ncbi:Leucine-rich repeat and IQ domain-containing protein 3 [Manis javanica]|nr:Leucine-rich repeat and IQ domain-containing protein 3 [Manis javanica]
MIKIDRLKKNQAALKEKSLIVRQKLETEKHQKDLVKQMKEIRAQEACKRHCEEKFVIDMIAFQKACERFQDSKRKVATIKGNLVFQVPSGITK